MIAVEWFDFDAPRFSAVVPTDRCGLLLSIGPGRVKGDQELQNVAYVITQRMTHDPSYGRTNMNEKIVLAVQLARLKIKGVHLPFEPYGAPK